MDTTEIKFTLTLPEVPENHRLEAEKKAKEVVGWFDAREPNIYKNFHVNK